MTAVGYYMGERVRTLGQIETEGLVSLVNEGMVDEQDGDVDSYGGHLARAFDRLLLTDSDGNRQAMLALVRPDLNAASVVVAHLIVAKHRLYREHYESECSRHRRR